ncbi:transglutaminase domain-containing protein [Snuella lapsa]|uniref:Transglutaminase-like domain-containing protein n=1 Tax=Snuella lapsa TaxID=870481 RepID=A0ABP6XPT6_9FLAO
MSHKLIVIIITLISLHLSSQGYNDIDEVVSNFPTKFKSIQDFATKINESFSTDLEKTRAVYYWISNNIAYDFEALKNKKNYFSYDSEDELINKMKILSEKVLKRKKAVCEGYSQLLKFTLKELNIECEVINGYAKKYTTDIGRKRNGSNHAWNCVKLNGKWQLIDATWSTGFSDENNKHFKFNDMYFLIDPEKLILTHLPNNPERQFLNTPIKKESFFSLPVFFSEYYNSGLKINHKTMGLIKAKENDTIKLIFDKADENRFYRYALKNNSFTTPFLFEREQDGYTAFIPIESKRSTSLTLYNDNGFAILEFKILIEK